MSNNFFNYFIFFQLFGIKINSEGLYNNDCLRHLRRQKVIDKSDQRSIPRIYNTDRTQ